MSTHHQTIEHIVLLNFKPDVDATKAATMIHEINGLASLNLTVHLSTEKILLSTSTSTNFSHIVHCRFSSTDNLQVYNHHPEHLRASKVIQPVIDDVMIVDWISNGTNDPLEAGSVMRVMLFKLKEDLVENETCKVAEVIEGIKSQFRTTQQISVGENFSHEMAKGHSIAMITVYPDSEAFDSDAELANLNKFKVKDFIESEVVLDYVVPSAKD